MAEQHFASNAHKEAVSNKKLPTSPMGAGAGAGADASADASAPLSLSSGLRPI